jgi:hypothetical protein
MLLKKMIMFSCAYKFSEINVEFIFELDFLLKVV